MLLSDRQKWGYPSKISFTPSEWNYIRFSPRLWDDQSYAIKRIKVKIKQHYLPIQNHTCAYCRLPLKRSYGITIDHIIPKEGKDGRKEFSFTPINLIMACHRCNTKKSTNNDLVDKDIISYPLDGIHFLIFHNHLDDYFKHISINPNGWYEAKTMKGFRTIERFKLLDTDLLEDFQEELIYKDNPILARIIDMMKTKKVSDRQINDFLDTL